MFQRSSEEYFDTPWGPSDGICRHRRELAIDTLPEAFRQALDLDDAFRRFYCLVDDGVDTSQQAYLRDLELMERLKAQCSSLYFEELLTVLNEFPNGLLQFFEYGILTVEDWCVEDRDYVEKLIGESDW